MFRIGGSQHLNYRGFVVKYAVIMLARVRPYYKGMYTQLGMMPAEKALSESIGV